mgnify:CR=1 FL=1
MAYEIVDLKRFLKDKSNLTLIVIIFVFILQLILGYFIFNDSSAIKKKIDHRYFCVTTSLEDIHDVHINTLNGAIRK